MNTYQLKCPSCGNTQSIDGELSDFAGRVTVCQQCQKVFDICKHLEDSTVNTTDKDDSGLFTDWIVIYRLDDNYPYIFFPGTTSFGRYDDRAQSGVMMSTEDQAIVPRHVDIEVQPKQSCFTVFLRNRTAGQCSVQRTDVGKDERIQLHDGDFIRLGKTDFIIRNLHKDNI